MMKRSLRLRANKGRVRRSRRAAPLVAILDSLFYGYLIQKSENV